MEMTDAHHHATVADIVERMPSDLLRLGCQFADNLGVYFGTLLDREQLLPSIPHGFFSL
jgi:hypothetical protein